MHRERQQHPQPQLPPQPPPPPLPQPLVLQIRVSMFDTMTESISSTLASVHNFLLSLYGFILSPVVSFWGDYLSLSILKNADSHFVHISGQISYFDHNSRFSRHSTNILVSTLLSHNYSIHSRNLLYNSTVLSMYCW